jgi:hypothetical protein
MIASTLRPTRNNDLPTVFLSPVFLFKEHGLWLLYGLARRQMSRLSCPLSPCDCKVAALNLKRAVEIPLGAAGRQLASSAVRDASMQLFSVRETTALMLMTTVINFKIWNLRGLEDLYCCLLHFDTVCSDKWIPTFRRSVRFKFKCRLTALNGRQNISVYIW